MLAGATCMPFCPLGAFALLVEPPPLRPSPQPPPSITSPLVLVEKQTCILVFRFGLVRNRGELNAKFIRLTPAVELTPI